MSQTSDIEFLEYIDSSANRLAELSDENQKLRTKVADLSEERVILQKVASAKPFEDSEVDELVETLGRVRVIDPLQSAKVATLVKEDPKKILDLVTKLAGLAVPSSGEGIKLSLIHI